ncbi:MAG TPA: LuxR C-terminal-related transcriptional regulator, partial [Chloroflexota bacterium]|nr:LuxR C-terminal-related transcriptional regulator [Chloroflexota bacterium]
PLALELAAGWITTLSVAEIAERLDDALGLLTRGVRGAPARQQTLRATLDLITARLTDAERRLFARVGVFNGSWNLDAARAVCADDIIPAPHVLPILAELVGKSLVQVAPSGRSAARYRLLEVIRQYALELLASAGELGTMRQRHAAWCQDLVGAMPVGAGSSDELQSLLYEHDNLRAALSWAIAEKDADLGLGLATRLHGVWYMQGQFSESRAWFARVLALDGGSVDQRASVANWASNHALCQGDFQAALALSEQARTMAAAACSNALMAISLDSWANILLDQCKLEQAAAVFQQERVLLLEEDSLGWLSACIDYREAAIALERGDHLEGERLCTSAMLALGQEPNVWIRLRVERAMGQVAFQRGDLDSAQARFEVVLNGTRQIHDLQGVIYALIDLAHVAQVRHRLPLARQRMRQALQAAEGHAEPLVQARAIEAAAALLAHARPEGTLQVLGATRRLRSSLGAPLWPLEGARVERALQVAHGRLGANAAGVAMASGEAVRPERAARIALDLLESLESSTPSSRPPHEVITPREQDVAALVAQGLTNSALAQALVISEGTVRAHVEHILNKLGARSRREIAERLQRGSPDGQVL